MHVSLRSSVAVYCRRVALYQSLCTSAVIATLIFCFPFVICYGEQASQATAKMVPPAGGGAGTVAAGAGGQCCRPGASRGPYHCRGSQRGVQTPAGGAARGRCAAGSPTKGSAWYIRRQISPKTLLTPVMRGAALKESRCSAAYMKSTPCMLGTLCYTSSTRTTGKAFANLTAITAVNYSEPPRAVSLFRLSCRQVVSSSRRLTIVQTLASEYGEVCGIHRG